MPSFRIPPPLRHILPAASCADVSPTCRARRPSPPSPPATSACRRSWASRSTCSTTGTSRPARSPSRTGSTRCSACRPGGFPRSIEGWLDRIHLDDHDATHGGAVARASSSGAPFSCEYRLRRGDGSWAARSTDQGVLLTSQERPRDEHDRRHARRHARARGAGRATARPTSCAGSSSACRARPCRSTSDGAYVDADDHALAFFERTAGARCWRSERRATTSRRRSSRCGHRRGDGGRQVAELDGLVRRCAARPRRPAAQHHARRDIGERARLLPARGRHHDQKRAMQEALARSERALRRQATILDERNAALQACCSSSASRTSRELEQRDRARTSSSSSSHARPPEPLASGTGPSGSSSRRCAPTCGRSSARSAQRLGRGMQARR